MALETGNYVSDLVITNPTGADNRRQGDDHLRLIKKVITQSFPNINGAVTATPAQLNLTADATNFIPSGFIGMWAGTIATIPAGWALCDGTGTAGGIAIPDLRDRFIIGADADAGGTRDVGDIGGSQDTTLTTTEGHTLTESEMPSHTHTLTLFADGVGSLGYEAAGTGSFSPTTSATGGDAPHSHNIAAVTDGNMPKYYALAYIIKL